MLVYFYHFQKWVGSVFSDHLYNFQSKGAKRHRSLMLSVLSSLLPSKKWGDIANPVSSLKT